MTSTENDFEPAMNPTFFPTPADFRSWLHEHHSQEAELWVGYYKKASKIPSITWPESVDQALCYGWIDGIRKSIDDKSYMIRFTPRRATSHWSDVNIKRVAVLKKEGLMMKTGLEAFKKRKAEKSARASYEQKAVGLDAIFLDKIKAHPKAWEFYSNLAPSYKKATNWWVMSAKKEETKWRRLDVLIQSASEGQKIPQLRPPGKK